MIWNSCLRYFTPHWHAFWNVALKFTAPCWKIGVRGPVWHPFPLKWHDGGIRLEASRHLNWAEKPLHMKRFIHVVFFPNLSLLSISRVYGMWCESFSFMYFLPTESLYCECLWCRCWKKSLLWTSTLDQVKSHNYGEQVGPYWLEVASLWNFQANWSPQPWNYAHLALWHNCKSLRYEVLAG